MGAIKSLGGNALRIDRDVTHVSAYPEQKEADRELPATISQPRFVRQRA